MKYKRLLYGRFCALKDNIVLQGSIFTSHGFFICYSITILIINKVLSLAMFEPSKVVGVSCVVVCKDNNKVNRCGVSVVVSKVINGVWIILLVWMVLWMELWMVGK